MLAFRIDRMLTGQALMMCNTITNRLVIFIVVLTCAVSAISCGGDETSADDRVIIRLSHWWGDSRDLWDRVISDFEKANPSIHIEQEVMPFNILKDKILAQSAAGEYVSDLVPLEDWFAQELVKRDYFFDLRPWIERDLNSDEYFSQSIEPFRNKRAIRAFPIALGTYPLFYNRDIFDRAGEEYPDTTWTFDTLVAVASRLTVDANGDGRPEQWGFMLDNSGGLDGTIWSQGGRILTADLKHGAMSEPATVRALQFWVDLVLKYRVAPAPASIMGGTSSGGAIQDFMTGRFAMAILGSHQVGSQAPFKWDITYPPKGSAGRKVLRFAAAFGIPRVSKHPEAAWKFIAWIVKHMSAQYSAQLFYGHIPNSRRLCSSRDFLECRPVIHRQILVDMINRFSFSYWRTKWFQFRDQGFLPEIDLAVQGDKSVLQAAVDGDAIINEVLQNE